MAERLELAQRVTDTIFSNAFLAQINIAEEEAKEAPIIQDGKVLCCGCREEIPKERLEVKPNAARCCSCQSRHHRQLEKFIRR